MNLPNDLSTVDITTTGRSSGKPRRIEIWMFEFEGRYLITGTPGPRDWYANLLADPNMTVHLPDGDDLAVVATPVDDPAFRRRAFTTDKAYWYRSQSSVDALVATSPMVELTLPG